MPDELQPPTNDDASNAGDAEPRLLRFRCDDCELDFDAPPDGTGYEQAACPQCHEKCISQSLLQRDHEQRREQFRKIRELVWPSCPTGADEVTRPRVGIAHLLLLMACVAVGSRSADHYRSQSGFAVVFAFAALDNGLTLWALPCGWLWRRRGYAFPAHPGEWLWLSQALNYVIGAIVWQRFVYYLYGVYDLTAPMLINITIPGILAFGCKALPLFAVDLPRRWRVFIALNLLTDATNLAPLMFGSIGDFLLTHHLLINPGMQVIWLLEQAALLYCVVVDWRQIKRPWGHWLGIVTFYIGSYWFHIIPYLVQVGS